MLLRLDGQGIFGADHPVPAPTWTDSTARRISNIASPPDCLLAISILATASLISPAAWLWAMVHILFAIVLPLLYLVRLFRRSAVADIELNNRIQRIRPLLAALTGTLLSLVPSIWEKRFGT